MCVCDSGRHTPTPTPSSTPSSSFSSLPPAATCLFCSPRFDSIQIFFGHPSQEEERGKKIWSQPTNKKFPRRRRATGEKKGKENKQKHNCMFFATRFFPQRRRKIPNFFKLKTQVKSRDGKSPHATETRLYLFPPPPLFLLWMQNCILFSLLLVGFFCFCFRHALLQNLRICPSVCLTSAARWV